MSYAYLTPNRYIRSVVLKLSPFVRLAEGESIAEYNPPQLDPKLQHVLPRQPVTGNVVEFDVIDNPNAAEHIKTQKIQVIQDHLDSGARTKGYSNILSAVSYAVDHASPFFNEAVAYAQWRSQCWAKGFEILNAVERKEIPIPTDPELIALLPSLKEVNV